MNYIRKSLEQNKQNKIEVDKINMQIEEEKKRKKIVIEMFKSKISNIKSKKSNINLNKNGNTIIKGNDVEENNQLRKTKIGLEDMMKDLRKNLENLKIENKSEITKLSEEKNKDKKIKEEAEKQRKKDEEEKCRKIKDEEENRRKIKEESEKQRKIKEESEKQRKKVEEEKQRKIKEEQEKQKRKEEEKKKKEKEKELMKEINNKKLLDKKKEMIDEKKEFDLMRTNTFQMIGYSYECTNLLILQQYVYEGTEFAEIPLMLKNTGPNQWPLRRTKLIFDKNYQIKGKNIELKSLQKNEEQQCIVKIEGLSKLPVGEYEAGAYININGVNVGKILKMKVIIKEKGIDPIDQYIETIKRFRNEYNLDEKENSNEDVFNILMSNEFNFEKAFLCIIGDN